MRSILRWFGFYKIDYGFSCGRHWIEIDGKVIAQSENDILMCDEDVHRLGYEILDNGKHWAEPKQF